MGKIVGGIVRALAGVLAVAILLFAFRLFIPISTHPFLDSKGRMLPHSIAEIDRWRINGIDESVIIRGRDTSNPVLVWVHGGPGQSETPVVRRLNAALEDHFTLVYWDQRYAGRSLDVFGPKPKSQSIEDYVSDLGELIARLKTRLHCKKVFVVAHSWGTAPALLYAERHPENVWAYVGVGQEADTPEAEKRSYAWVLGEARAHGDKEAIARLIKMGPPPRVNGDDWTPRDLLEKYGGVFHANLSVSKLALMSMTTTEVNWRDVVGLLFAKGYNEKIDREEAKVVFDRDHLKFGEPIFFVSGRYDHTVDAGLAQRYLAQLSAPRKAFILFDNSAHSPPFEEPQKFNAFLIDTVRPIAGN